MVRPTWLDGIGAPFGLGWITDPLVKIKNVAIVICEEETLAGCGAPEADFPLEFPVIVLTTVMVVTVVIVETIVEGRKSSTVLTLHSSCEYAQP